MKNKLLLGAILMAMIFSLQAQTVFFSEDFESTTAGELTEGWTMELGDAGLVWTVEEAKTVHDEDNGDWESNAFEGSKSLFNVENWGAEGPTDVIVYTPAIDLSNATSVNLSFHELRSWDNYWPEAKPEHNCYVVLKEVGANDVYELAEITYAQENFQNWQEVSVNLDDFVGKNIHVGFKSNSHHYFWRIDNVVIDGEGVGIKDQSAELGFSVYPNPTINKVRVELHQKQAAQKVEVYNALGLLVMTQNIDIKMQVIDFENLPSGVYYITVGNSTQKLVKK